MLDDKLLTVLEAVQGYTLALPNRYDTPTPFVGGEEDDIFQEYFIFYHPDFRVRNTVLYGAWVQLDVPIGFPARLPYSFAHHLPGIDLNDIQRIGDMVSLRFTINVDQVRSSPPPFICFGLRDYLTLPCNHSIFFMLDGSDGSVEYMELRNGGVLRSRLEAAGSPNLNFYMFWPLDQILRDCGNNDPDSVAEGIIENRSSLFSSLPGHEGALTAILSHLFYTGDRRTPRHAHGENDFYYAHVDVLLQERGSFSLPPKYREKIVSRFRGNG